MKKGADVLDISDISTQELKTAIITNPETRANIEIELMKKRIETEKNKFLADSAFVLRKYDSFIKIQEEVTKAQHNYNRILGYSKEEGENAEYWKNQLPFYQKTIDLTKEKVQEEIDILSQKGVNVTEIEQQTKITEDKIAELDKRLEDLPNVREELVEKYRKEKEMQLKVDANYDYLGEREVENSMLFDAVVEQKFEKEINEIDIENEQKSFYRRR